MKRILMLSLVCTLFTYTHSWAQRNYNPPPMLLDVGHVNMSMDKKMGDGGLQSQFSWNLTGNDRQRTEIFYWPQDEWQSNILYQIFNPVSLDDNGILREDSVRVLMFTRSDALTNYGITDWAIETRRYRPPHIIVDGTQIDQPYPWKVDRTIPSGIKLEFEDVLPQFGIRSHVEVYGFSNPQHGDYFIWKATHKFTGEIKLPRDAVSSKDSLPDQTIRFWWPLSFSFGPSKAGERNVLGGFSYEGEDDLDSWLKRKSEFTPGARDSLFVAYYWDSKNSSTQAYANGSKDDTGDPDRTTGFLYSTQIAGFTLLHADKSAADKSDDVNQPYAMPHATIVKDLWGRRDVGLRQTYRGDDTRGRFPPDAITAGFATSPEKGPMRFITVGPYELTKNKTIKRFDSVTFVYAVGVGGIGWNAADSIGKLWINNQITDSVKNVWVMKGRDSLWKVLEKANWAWNQLSTGAGIPPPPPPPDIEVKSGPNRVTVNWSYEDPSYFIDPVKGTNDWKMWRVYRKRGAYLVNDPLDQKSNARWEFVYETTDPNVQSYVDSTVQRGVDYYYSVTAADADGLESSRFMTRSQLPAVAFKPVSGESSGKPKGIRVVPNPATVAAGKGLTSGTPDKISFYNLPKKCTLRIFTETGDLVKTMQHYGTADHEWNQRTDENQYVSSGIYILAVTDAEDADGKRSANEFVKFIIVR